MSWNAERFAKKKETALRRGVLEKLESVKTVERDRGEPTELNGEGPHAESSGTQSPQDFIWKFHCMLFI